MSELSLQSLSFLQAKSSTKAKGGKAQITFIGRGSKIPGALSKSLPAPIRKRVKEGSSVESLPSSRGTHFLVQSQFIEPGSHNGLFTPSAYAMARDLVGTCARQILNAHPTELKVQYEGASEEELRGLLVGIEMASYQFKQHWPQKNSKPCKIVLKSGVKKQSQVFAEAAALGEAVNVARFLVDCPPNVLGPKSYSEVLKKHFAKKAKTKVVVWDHNRLKKEKMGLHLAVGQGSVDKSYMVHIEYRGAGKDKPIAFVGKGITFDSGGLDIKPASGMRLMKKDMGGSAAVAGLAHYVVNSKLKMNCDFYFAIAENAVGESSFRPSDVITARNGKTVEIHNTDAEGRLVMADVLTVAAEKKPQYLIDLATLTGAIKYGLGAATPGLFSNHDGLAEVLLKSGQAHGDVFWRMPLVPEEGSRLKSEVADMVNCTDGFGGAITAALFLERFVAGVPWAHFDIYAWMDRPKGPFAQRGGSGASVQALAHFLLEQAQ